MRFTQKNSTVTTDVPVPADLLAGEIATNSADGKLFIKNTSGSIVEIGKGSSLTNGTISGASLSVLNTLEKNTSDDSGVIIFVSDIASPTDADVIRKKITTIKSPGERGIAAGGYTGSVITNVIDYITISSTGNATDFGDLTVARSGVAGTSNGTNERGIFGGGSNNPTPQNVIDYITISTLGNAIDFGDLTSAGTNWEATSNGTNDRGIFIHPDSIKNIDYITISTTGNGADFGDLTANSNGVGGTTSNGINERGVNAGGYSTPSYLNVIEYITISTTGNGTDFGDLTIARSGVAGTSNGTNERGIFGGGNTGTYSNTIDYITISTTGNATDFGDFITATADHAAASNGTNERGVFFHGHSVTIEYITISTPGNATDFGDLTVQRYPIGGTSNGLI